MAMVLCAVRWPVFDHRNLLEEGGGRKGRRPAQDTTPTSSAPFKPSFAWAQAVGRHNGHVEGRLWETKEDGGYGLSSTVGRQELVETEASSSKRQRAADTRF